MAKKDSESKSMQLARFLSGFTHGDFSVAELARKFKLEQGSVVHVARMNPQQLSVRYSESRIIIKDDSGITTRTGHNVLEDGQLATSFKPDRHTISKHKRGSRNISKWLSGNNQ